MLDRIFIGLAAHIIIPIPEVSVDLLGQQMVLADDMQETFGIEVCRDFILSAIDGIIQIVSFQIIGEMLLPELDVIPFRLMIVGPRFETSVDYYVEIDPHDG